ncbi:hypothetical protein GRF29_8g3287650 [Pseudopithomyces chartarum]|uniref:RRM domain-containing protein n=1 Tax=Pseudopithomyces chartarum TaxID=1892770 RepID=A0AAN6RKD6_9PLEO|nr:hypothetical protein GRF29_8g3287650 [Pseudopithomyces chartarum]
MAASDVQNKKRKGATDSQPKAKKARKSDDIAATKTAAKPARKQAADFFSDDEKPAPVEATKPKKGKKTKTAEVAKEEDVVIPDAPEIVEVVKETKKKTKKPKKGEEAPVVTEVTEEVSVVAEEKPKKAKKGKKEETVVVEEVVAPVEEKKTKKGKKSNKQEAEPVVETVVEVEEAPVAEDSDENSGDEDEALDDQTAALLAGFESDRDESDAEKEDEDFDEDALPEMGKEISKKKRKELEKARRDAEPGVIYLGRIPHGFFEPQMKKYFSQFGTVRRLRLSRNKKTGASKHYAFVEFANSEVADIVAKTMHNYLMFGHILQCRVVPQEQVHPELFKGANERFKVDPRNQKEGAAMARGATRDVWEKRVKKETKRRAAKSKALLEEFGYEFEAPAIKSVDSVPKKTAALEGAPAQKALPEAETAAEPKAAIEAAPAAEEVPEVKVRRSKRKSDVAPEPVEAPAEVAAPKAKKAKKEPQVQEGAVAEKKRRVSQTGAGAKKAKKAKA